MLPKSRLAKFAAIGCFLISLQPRFAQEPVGQICWYWLFPDLTITTNNSIAADFAQEPVDKICYYGLFPDLDITASISTAAKFAQESTSVRL